MRQDSLCKSKTVKVPRGNAFQLLMPFKTSHWEDESIVPEDLDILSLDNVHITIAGIEWTDFEMDPRGPIVTIGADDFDAVGAYDAEITAEYCGVAIRGAFFECFTRVEWSFESNVEQHLPDSPLIAETSYVYIGITDDEELEALKQQYREATAACETARLEYEAAKEEFDEKAEQLDDVAQQTTLVEGIAAVLQGFAPLATTEQLNTVAQDILTAISHIDIDTTTLAKEQTLTNGIQSILTALNPKATTADVTAAKQAILDALSHIAPEDPNSKALAEFFGVTLLQGYEFMQDTEVTDELEDIMQALDPELGETVEYPEGSGTYMTKAQAITAEAMEIINPSKS